MISIFEDNPNCAETHVTFRIVGDDLDPENITNKLQIRPSAVAAKGQTNPLSHMSKPQLARVGFWYLTTRGIVESKNLEAHLICLLDQLAPSSAQIRNLANSSNLRVEFHCYWMSETGYGGPILSPKVLERISNLGATLDFDLYFSGDWKQKRGAVPLSGESTSLAAGAALWRTPPDPNVQGHSARQSPEMGRLPFSSPRGRRGVARNSLN
jgi:hypothetical protein